jgi:phage tail-like protein
VGEGLPFQEVSGLDTEAQPIEYRAGNNKVWSTIKMPGLVKTGNVTLKKGVFAKDNKFWTWYEQIKLNTIKRATVTIKLLDEGGNPTMVWTLANAWPTKITGTDLKSDGNEVAVESVEIAHEGLKIENK